MKLRNIFGRRDPSGWHILYETGVEFSFDVHSILVSRFHEGYHRSLTSEQPEVLTTLNQLGIPLSAELSHLYLNYGPFCVPSVYHLNEIDSLLDWTEYAHQILEVDRKYLALTSIEGQGITLYDRSDGKIYDVGFGEFEMLANCEIEPAANTVSDFILWCGERDVEEIGQITDL